MDLAGCWRHLTQDVQRKMIADGVPQNTRVLITSRVYSLLRSYSQSAYDNKLEELSKDWPSAFKQHYMDFIHTKIEHFGMWHIHSKFQTYVTEYGITSNQSEGFNWLLHDLQDWKEAPSDCAILGLKCCSPTTSTRLDEENLD